MRALNEGRGSNPGDTWSSSNELVALRADRHRSTKAGGRTPATPISIASGAILDVHVALNEGRGSNPGDTSVVRLNAVVAVAVEVAQRRPGVEPRRHLRARVQPATMLPPFRSTKAGGRTPATPDAMRSSAVPADFRRRSTKAGGRTPATPAEKASGTSHSRPRSLNEGRGSNPGDTRHWSASRAPICRVAQRRPGVEPRRHLRMGSHGRIHQSISVTAQRRPGVEPRRHLRQVVEREPAS